MPEQIEITSIGLIDRMVADGTITGNAGDQIKAEIRANMIAIFTDAIKARPIVAPGAYTGEQLAQLMVEHGFAWASYDPSTQKMTISNAAEAEGDEDQSH